MAFLSHTTPAAPLSLTRGRHADPSPAAAAGGGVSPSRLEVRTSRYESCGRNQSHDMQATAAASASPERAAEEACDSLHLI